MATNTAALFDSITNFTPNSFGNIGNIIPWLFWAIVFGILLGVLHRLMTHSIFVERLTLVKGGYVSTGGRYAEVFDKYSELWFLRPIFGKARLPIFPSNHYQKVKSLPFLGVKRELMLIYINKFNPIPKVIVPTQDNKRYGIIKDVDIKRWLFINQRQEFIRKLKQADIVYMLSILAPTIIIFGSIIFFTITILLQASITTSVGNEMKELFLILKGMYGG